MDHLEIEQAVVMGTSLGANTALEIASVAPERLRGMVIEMPVLDNGLLPSALTFTPLLVALTFGEPLMKLLAWGTRAVPRRLLPHYGNVMLDLVRQEPGPSGALIQGLFFGRIAPHRSERRTFTMPTLVLGHHRDPVHPFSDAGMLAKELPNGRLLEADSLGRAASAARAADREIASSWTRSGAHAAAAAHRAAERAAALSAGRTRGAARSFGARTVPVRSPLTCARRLGVPTAECGRLADPQRDEPEQAACRSDDRPAQLDLGGLALPRVQRASSAGSRRGR